MFIRIMAMGTVINIKGSKADEYQIMLNDAEQHNICVNISGSKLVEITKTLKIGDRLIADCRTYPEGVLANGSTVLKLYANYIHLIG